MADRLIKFNSPIHHTEKNGVPVEVAMQYNDSFSENVHSYVNNINTIEGGTHLTGFRRALLNRPRLLLADEPTGTLDPLTADGIIRLFQEIARQGCAAVSYTHLMVWQYNHRTRHRVLSHGRCRMHML